jgi:hypothetical protein
MNDDGGLHRLNGGGGMVRTQQAIYRVVNVAIMRIRLTNHIG